MYEVRKEIVVLLRLKIPGLYRGPKCREPEGLSAADNDPLDRVAIGLATIKDKHYLRFRTMPAQTFDRLARRSAICGISAYQRHLSPYKGFSCPHRMLHQGESCSSYVKQLLGQQNLLSTVQMASQRFQHCHAAAKTLRWRGLRSQGGCIVIPCCIPI